MLKKIFKNFFEYFGYKIISKDLPIDFSEFEKELIRKVQNYTMTSPERLKSLIDAINYIIRNNISGSFVECGVWRGGSMMAAMLVLISLKETNRQFYLYDTFEGMSEPSEYDIDYSFNNANKLLNINAKNKENKIWCYSPIEDVKKNISTTNYPLENVNYIQGKVENTIPKFCPEKIALLRLDTDWYESTKHELEQLFPKLVKGGILIVDDYGFWKGSKKAVDEFFDNKKNHFFHRIDDTGIIIIKNY